MTSRPPIVTRLSVVLMSVAVTGWAWVAILPAFGARGLEELKHGHCRAMAPSGWALHTNDQGSTAELMSPDRSQYAGWGVAAIKRAMQPYYGDMYGDPETSIRFLTAMILRGSLGDASAVQYTSPPQSFRQFFQIRSIASQAHTGYVFYRIYADRWPQTYTESVYWAIVTRAQQAQVKDVVDVAASIRCTTQVLKERNRP